MIIDAGLAETAKYMTGQSTRPTHIAIGTGSATLTSGATVLTTETDRNLISEYSAIGAEVTYISDWAAAEVSGTTLTEFGLFNSISGTGMYQKEVIGSIVFDGSRELQIQMSNSFVQP